MVTASTLRRHAGVEPKGTGVTLSALHPAFRSGRTMFPSRVFDPDEVQRVLKDGHQSRKIGKTVQTGRLRGAPIFTLTLEERATCPRSCAAWACCYGNGMQAAERVVAGKPLEDAIWSELTALQAAHPRGFLVRLHVLGDFYSAAYADLWGEAFAAFPALNVFGYTANPPESEIGRVISRLNARHADRCFIRFSGLDEKVGGAVVVERGDDTPHTVCLAQRGLTNAAGEPKADCCATCALCWSSDRTIAFWRH